MDQDMIIQILTGMVLRTQLTPLMDKYDIDVVLQGHDHTYPEHISYRVMDRHMINSQNRKYSKLRKRKQLLRNR